MRKTGFVVAALLLVVITGACRKQQPPETPVPVATPTPPPPPPPPPPAPRDDAAAAELARKRNVVMEMVFFDYDRSDIRQDAAATLQTKLPILREETGIRIRVEGHADERGSIEYNLALGLRRAQSVKDYLVSFGIDASRIAVESYGEDRPLDPRSNEQAWARNRRAEFVITAGLSN
jgi:peptidoglycan-associated lipoprotein